MIKERYFLFFKFIYLFYLYFSAETSRFSVLQMDGSRSMAGAIDLLKPRLRVVTWGAASSCMR